MKLKLLGILFLSTLILITSCSKYDDSALSGRVEDLEGRVSELEKLVADLNSNVQTLSASVKALENEDRIVSITPLSDGSGYEIVFSKMGKMVIKNGEKPSISVEQGEDGVWYWTVDGEPLLADGNKIPATIAPEFKIENGQLWFRLNGGEWTVIPGAETGIGLVQDVRETEEDVTLVLSDGREITIPKVQSFALELDIASSDFGIMENQTITIEYTVVSGDKNTLIKAISEGGYNVSINATDYTKGYISITAPSTISAKSSILIVAVNGKGEMAGKIIVLEKGELSLIENTVTLGKNGGEFIISIKTNMNYQVQIAPDSGWITQLPETKAIRTDELKFNAAPHEEEGSRTGTIDIIYGDGQKLTYTVIQTDQIIANGGEADFETFTSSPSLINFVDDQTTNGWVLNHGAILGPMQWDVITEKAPALSGKISSPGTLTSPTIEGGCGTLTFIYGTTIAPALLKEGLKFKVEVMSEDGTIVNTSEIIRAKADITMKTEYTEKIDVNCAGKFTIVFTNLCPQQLDSRDNLDMFVITSVSWTGYSE